ncbi:protein kinase [Streptomyces sp. NPDC058740]|uniref:serine/threonine-protein kinase n=1 Tax=Streptomyces sp. NPDC058740 TaxID=3346619 RepID=UPI00369D0476
MKPLAFGDPLRLGPYRLLGVLGEGGMGKVYVAAGADGRPAAVKVLRPELAHDRHLAQRFVREAHTAQAVTSSGVARVLGADLEGGRPWIATEFLAGPTLDEAVAQHGPFDEPTVRALAAALAGTLRDIHAAGLIHRDVKPPNIVLTSDGPRIIDFGIARPEHGLTLTTTGQIPVTPGYGAPEQVLGRRVTGSADVFSLGAVLVYAATGRRAYDGAHVAAVQYAVVHEEPNLAGLPPALHLLIAPCLARDPVLRPTPEQVAEAFAPDRKGRDVWRRGAVHQEAKRREAEIRRQTSAAAATATAVEPTGSGPSRRRFLAAWGAGGAVLLAGAGGTAWWLGDRGANALPPEGDAPEARLLDNANAGIRPTPLWGPVDVAATGPLPPPVALRDVVIFPDRNAGLTALRVVDGSMKWTLPDIAKTARQLPLNEAEFAAAQPSGRLVVHNASTSAENWSMAEAQAAFLLAAGPDTLYVLTTEGRLRAVDLPTRTIRWTVASTERATDTRGPLAAAGSDHLVLSGSDGTVTAYDKTTGRAAWKLPDQTSESLQPAVDNDTVYLGGRTLTAVSLATGKPLWSIDPSPQHTWGPPAVDAAGVTATQGRAVRRYAKDGSSPDFWYADLNGDSPDSQPPVVQGDCVWTVESPNGESGVSGLSIPEGRRVWTYERDDTGPWAMTAKANRVFLISKGKVAALPTF